MTDEERFKRIEEAIILMKDLLVSHENRLDGHGQRLDDYYKAMRESREDFNFKINALTDAQIRNETETLESREDFNFKLNALIDLQMSNEMEVRELKEASKSQLTRIERIENK